MIGSSARKYSRIERRPRKFFFNFQTKDSAYLSEPEAPRQRLFRIFTGICSAVELHGLPLSETLEVRLLPPPCNAKLLVCVAG